MKIEIRKSIAKFIYPDAFKNNSVIIKEKIKLQKLLKNKTKTLDSEIKEWRERALYAERFVYNWYKINYDIINEFDRTDRKFLNRRIDANEFNI